MRSGYLLVFLLALCLMLSSLSAAFAATYTVTGTVTDEYNAPLLGATVEVRVASTSTLVGSGTTGTGGIYSIDIPTTEAATDYLVSAHKTNYLGLSGDQPVTVPPSPATVAVITLQSYIPHTVSGTVRDGGGNALGGVQVSAALDLAGLFTTRWDAITVITAGNGTYTMPGLIDGQYYCFAARKFGWRVTTSPGSMEFIVDSDKTLDIAMAAAGPLISVAAHGLAPGIVNSWPNTGSLGGAFVPLLASKPSNEMLGALLAVKFATQPMVLQAGGVNVLAPASLTGNPAYTVSAWVLNPAVGDADSYLAWASRFGVNVNMAPSTDCEFSYSSNAGNGAVNHWNDDLGWGSGGYPAAGAWHNLIITNDGVVETAYVDGVAVNSKTRASGLVITPDNPITLGTGYFYYAGAIYDQQDYTGYIAALKVWSGAAQAADVAALYAQPPTQEALVVVTVKNGTTPIPNALVQFNNVAKVTGADGIAMFPTPASTGIYPVAADGPKFNANSASLDVTSTTAGYNVTVSLTPNPTENVIFAQFDAGVSGWETFIRDGTNYTPSGGLDVTGLPYPFPNPDMYSLTAAGGGAKLTYANPHPRPGHFNWYTAVTYTGTITGSTATTLTDANEGVDPTPAWPTLYVGFDPWGNGVEVQKTDGTFVRYPILAVNTVTKTLTLVPGATLDTDVALGTTYTIHTDVGCWWYPGFIRPTAENRLSVTPGQTVNFYFKHQATGACPGASYKLIFRDASGAEIERTEAEWDGSSGSRVGAAGHVVPAGAATVEPWLGTLDGWGMDNIAWWWSRGPTLGVTSTFDDVVVDVAGGAPAPTDVANIAALKAAADGALVRLTGSETAIYAPVNAGVRTTTFFYVGEAQGLGGLRVVDAMGDTLALGNSVTNLVGNVRKPVGAEPYLELTTAPTGTAGTAIRRLGMNNKAAATDANAKTNAVKVWGKVKSVNGTISFTITDGYGPEITVNVKGVELPAGFDTTKTAVVTGVLNGSGAVEAQDVKAF